MPPRVKWKEFILVLTSQDWSDENMMNWLSDMPCAFTGIYIDIETTYKQRPAY